jgi:hypothetical protein
MHGVIHIGRGVIDRIIFTPKSARDRFKVSISDFKHPMDKDIRFRSDAPYTVHDMV